MARSGKYRPGPDGSDTQAASSPQGDGVDRLSKNASKAARREAARAEMLRAEAAARRRSRLLMAVSVLAAIIVIVVVVVVVANHSSNSNDTASGSTGETSADPSVIKTITTVPANVFNTVGAGSVTTKPIAVPNPKPLTADGKPRILYVGAEYCPYCAAERWGLVAALSRFGTFSNLGFSHSSSTDIDPNTPTLSFHGSSYTSNYVSLTAVEQLSNVPQGNSYAPLDSLSSADQHLLDTYDTQTYTHTDSGGIPFIDLGGKYVSSGASYDPQLLAGKTQQQVAAALSNTSDPITQAIIGTANVFTAKICQLTGNKPAAVCTSPGVTAAAS